MQNLEGRVCLVTGAGAGIGRAVVSDLVVHGARVVAVDVSAEALEDLQAAEGSAVLAVPADVTDHSAIEQAVDRGVARFGEVSVVAAIAGISRLGALGEMDLGERDRILDVNFNGVWNAFQASLPSVRRSGQAGRLIACGSVESVLGTAGLSAYVASKHAVLGLVRSLALELADEGITVNAISPAGVRTPMMEALLSESQMEHVARTTPLRRFSTPAEIASFFTFVAGTSSGYMTGENVVVDGGVQVVNSHTFSFDPS